MADETMVGHHMHLIELGQGFQLVQKVIDDGLIRDGQKRLGEIFGQRIKPGGITRRQNDGFHGILSLIALIYSPMDKMGARRMRRKPRGLGLRPESAPEIKYDPLAPPNMGKR